MKTALSHGANFWNGGEFYGTPSYNSMTILRQYFTENPSDADKVVLSIKGGLTAQMQPDGSKEGVRRSVDTVLEQLGGTKFLDLFECARVDPNTPIETTIAALAEYVKAGKLGGISLSEVKAETIRRAAKVHPIAAVEVEFSLWATDILENGIAATCAELGIPIIAYSPLGRGFLTGQLKSPEDIPADDHRKHMPRFQPDVFDQNLELVNELKKLATKKGCTAAQLGLAWVKQCSGKNGLPVIIPIPGATKEKRVTENMVDVTLTNEDLDEIDVILKKAPVIGDRYGGAQAAMMNG